MNDVESRRNRLREILEARGDLSCLAVDTVDSIMADLDEFLIRDVIVQMHIPTSQLGPRIVWWLLVIETQLGGKPIVRNRVVTGDPIAAYIEYCETHRGAHSLRNTVQLTEDQAATWNEKFPPSD